MIWLLALLLAQPATLNLNQQPIISRQNGARLSTQRQFAVDCYGGTACSVDGGVLRIWTADAGASSPGGGSSSFDGGYSVVQDEGVPLTKRTTIDFTGAGVTCTDTGSKTACDIPGGGGGASQSPLSIVLGTP
jgi:hypothetical protein